MSPVVIFIKKHRIVYFLPFFEISKKREKYGNEKERIELGTKAV